METPDTDWQKTLARILAKPSLNLKHTKYPYQVGIAWTELPDHRHPLAVLCLRKSSFDPRPRWGHRHGDAWRWINPGRVKHGNVFDQLRGAQALASALTDLGIPNVTTGHAICPPYHWTEDLADQTLDGHAEALIHHYRSTPNNKHKRTGFAALRHARKVQHADPEQALKNLATARAEFQNANALATSPDYIRVARYRASHWATYKNFRPQK